ncbi:MAG: porin family protein [Cystobacterineae bacterium]|nr:porin family protein [Cystobacterineae bacterium]
MRAFFWISLVAALCFAAPAQAQYANKSLGISLGGMGFSAREEPVRWGIPLNLEASLYIENGWDVGMQVPLLFLVDKTNKWYFTLGTSFNFRYLFMEERIRPYLGAQLGFIYIFRQDNSSFFLDIGPILGVDFFISNSVSIGPRFFSSLYWALNERVRISYGAVIAAHVYF